MNRIVLFGIVSTVLLLGLCISPDFATAQGTSQTIIVEKSAKPAFDTEFSILAGLPEENLVEIGVVSDPGNSPSTFNIVCEDKVVIIAEQIPEGWEVYEASCFIDRVDRPLPCKRTKLITEGLFGFRCGCNGIENINCSFTNIQAEEEASCNLDITVESSGDEVPFNISAGEFNEDFELDNDQEESFVDLPLATSFAVTEMIPPGFLLDDISCEGDAEFSAIADGNTVNVTCIEPANVTCTFTNTVISRPIPTLSQWGLIAMAGVLGIIGLIAIRRRKLQVSKT